MNCMDYIKKAVIADSTGLLLAGCRWGLQWKPLLMVCSHVKLKVYYELKSPLWDNNCKL